MLRIEGEKRKNAPEQPPLGWSSAHARAAPASTGGWDASQVRHARGTALAACTAWLWDSPRSLHCMALGQPLQPALQSPWDSPCSLHCMASGQPFQPACRAPGTALAACTA
eukprot:365414-Chlamydomonas_euryale.AAC.3